MFCMYKASRRQYLYIKTKQIYIQLIKTNKDAKYFIK